MKVIETDGLTRRFGGLTAVGALVGRDRPHPFEDEVESFATSSGSRSASSPIPIGGTQGSRNGVYEQRWLPVSRGGTDTLSLAIIEAGPM